MNGLRWCLCVLLLLRAAECAAQTDSTVPLPRKPERPITTEPPPKEKPLRQRDAAPAPPPKRRDRELPPEPSESHVSSTPTAPDSPSVAQAPAASNGTRARAELIVAAVDLAQSEEQRAFLAERGAQLLRRRLLPNLGWTLSVFRLPPGVSPTALSAELSQRWPDAMPEPNQRYQPMGAAGDAAPSEYARALVEWPEHCDRRLRIAMLDGAVNRDLPLFSGRRIITASLMPPGNEADAAHGTALASLLLGLHQPDGLLPESELLVGVIMAKSEDGPYTTTEWLLRGLDWTLGLQPAPAALNLSFGGPRSAQVDRALRRVLVAMPVAAAAGNSGRREPSYPAAYDGVIGVSAVDAAGRRWPRANSGAHVSIAAPGAQVWARGPDGHGYYADGTSIATVFVTAALALRTSTAMRVDWLALHSRDAGPAGKDPDFGLGILAMGRACPGGK